MSTEAEAEGVGPAGAELCATGGFGSSEPPPAKAKYEPAPRTRTPATAAAISAVMFRLGPAPGAPGSGGPAGKPCAAGGKPGGAGGKPGGAGG
ncbi:hypothetical protein SSAG_04471 [Streptomyces sp. Mg1]|nr:hypothetical protein SSAG_04471 [Streptomyces sp. Mg1]